MIWNILNIIYTIIDVFMCEILVQYYVRRAKCHFYNVLFIGIWIMKHKVTFANVSNTCKAGPPSTPYFYSFIELNLINKDT